MKKRLVSLLLCLCMLMSLTSMVLAAGLPFVDVSRGDWFYDDVRTAYNDGLINGKTADQYKPNDNMTVAEAVKLAACMNQLYYDGKVTLKNGNPWYKSYMDYAMLNGIISSDLSSIADTKITREFYVDIFYHALPAKDYTEINEIADDAIPDVGKKDNYASSIYAFYRAGILTGNDAKGTFSPRSNIRRSEVAAILVRMMYPEARKEVSLDDGKLKVKVTPDSYTDKSNDMSFTATVTGGKKPYEYEWVWRDDDNTRWDPLADYGLDCDFYGANAKELYLELTDTQRSKNIELCCIVTDAAGTVTRSEPIPISAKSVKALKIVEQPESVKADKGEQVIFAVEVTGGTAPYEFYWETRDDINTGWIRGSVYINSAEYKTGSTMYYTVSEFDLEFNSEFRCVIEDADGNEVASDVVSIQPKAGPLKITEQPIDMTVKKNYMEANEVRVSGGTKPYTYDWEYSTDGGKTWKYDGLMSETTNREYSLFEASFDKTTYLRCTITDAAGKSVRSNTVCMKVGDPLSAKLSITSATVATDEAFRVTCSASGGTAPYTYQWYWAGSNGSFYDMSTYATFDTDTYSMYARPDPRYDVQYLRCEVTDNDGNSVFSDTLTIYLKK